MGERRMTGGLESEESWMRGHLGHQALVQGHLGHQGNHGNRRRKGGGKVDERLTMYQAISTDAIGAIRATRVTEATRANRATGDKRAIRASQGNKSHQGHHGNGLIDKKPCKETAVLLQDFRY